MQKNHFTSKLGYYLIIPSLLATLIFMAYPFVKAIFMGFTNYNMATGISRYVGWRNYAQLIKDPIFRLSLKNSFVCTGAVVTGQFVLCFLLALLLNLALRGRGILGGFTLLPLLVPTVVVVLAWCIMFI